MRAYNLNSSGRLVDLVGLGIDELESYGEELQIVLGSLENHPLNKYKR